MILQLAALSECRPKGPTQAAFASTGFPASGLCLVEGVAHRVRRRDLRNLDRWLHPHSAWPDPQLRARSYFASPPACRIRLELVWQIPGLINTSSNLASPGLPRCLIHSRVGRSYRSENIWLGAASVCPLLFPFPLPTFVFQIERIDGVSFPIITSNYLIANILATTSSLVSWDRSGKSRQVEAQL